ncbi:hypothetical protein GC425_03490 [Corynebacterium sp. zg254]|uniref:Uncharacterized protein n=1 Tax=Corynebacterium zhongnanshanii TaxID=2768834 RepID=A0ABQ6VF24_9CORY|nr:MULTISPECIES: hypothetical protein [Corynebacterium]KAB3522985.1 hypothetical protein F8377_02130 [Corynebacterium zhongnanshanii]MCR5913932.1 hypothetical protein [Corynebacterium sp. zg254]
MRVYIPATFDMLSALKADGEHPIRSGVAFALTPAVREFYTGGDEEELAYTAFLDAARASLRLLASGDEQRFPHRRVVISADIADASLQMSPADGESVVRVSPAVLSIAQLAAIHVDDADAEAATAKAITCIDEADLGDEDAELALGDAEDNLMSWYDAKELAFLVDLL